MSVPTPRHAWHPITLGELVDMPSNEIVGLLSLQAASHRFGATKDNQVIAWKGIIELLQVTAKELLRISAARSRWAVVLEYEIPRRQRRIDVVLLTDRCVFAMEFKVGASEFSRADLWQAEDYALDLQDFHRGSQGTQVIPFLVCTGSNLGPRTVMGATMSVECIGSRGLSGRLAAIDSAASPLNEKIDPISWVSSPYAPTPSIIESTRLLFAGHEVQKLTHAYADNLKGTLTALREAVDRAKQSKEHVICFVTGVPGAGKTLAGIAAMHGPIGAEGHVGAYLSGNGPLVRVLRESLARDAAERGVSLKNARREASTLIQNVHEFVVEYGLKKPHESPFENVVTFDEAQRAWDAKKLAKRHAELVTSEAAVMLDIMGRPEWSVLVALVGGGQEIHDGEAGIAAWGDALRAAVKPWRVVASPEVLAGGLSVSGFRLFDSPPAGPLTLEESPSLHLSVSVRSPRAKLLAEWIDALLAGDCESGRRSAPWNHGFRMGLTRSLEKARQWLRDASRGETQTGLLASSGNLRLRAYGLEVQQDFLSAYPLEKWFLAPPEDFLSSSSLEVAMTEFKVQGLELDLVGLAWGDDLTLTSTGQWEARRLAGSKWKRVADDRARQYVLNKYRVLLSRAREGMVIWVPQGDPQDPTRDPDRLNRVASLVAATGIPNID